MNNQKQIISGIDIGTTKIAVIIAEYDSENITILGHGIAPSYGLEKGEVIDVPLTRDSIQEAISQAEQKANYNIESVFIGITGEHINGLNYSGVVIIDESNETEIEESDIIKVRDRTRSISLPSERKILHVLDQDYRVDEKMNIQNPKGLYGKRLELNAHLVTISKGSEKNLRNCLNDSINIDSFVLEPLASAYAVLNKQERELGTVLIDIGGGTTDIIIYKNNGVQDSGAIPMGGNIITRDIALGIQQKTGECLENKELETLKHDYGSAKKEGIDQSQTIILNIDNREITINEYDLADIIQSRMTEIFQEVKRKISKSNISNNPFGIVITGGGSQLKNTEILAQEIFEQNVVIGYPRNINGTEDIIRNPRFSTAIGLIKYGIVSSENQGSGEGGISVKSILKNLFTQLKKLYKKWY